MKISTLLTAMLLVLSLQAVPALAHSDHEDSGDDKGGYEHTYNKDHEHHDDDEAKDRDRNEHGDKHRDASAQKASSDGLVNDSILPDWWPF